MASLYHYLDRRTSDLSDDDLFTLSAIRTWVCAARSGRCPQAMLRSGFAVRHVEDAMLAFLCGMTLVDQHGHATMRFAELGHPAVSDDEARMLTLFAAARVEDPRLIGIAANLVDDGMAMQLAGAAATVGLTMRQPT